MESGVFTKAGAMAAIGFVPPDPGLPENAIGIRPARPAGRA